MKKQYNFAIKKSKGIALLDVLVGIGILAVLTAVVLSRGERADGAQVNQRLVDEVSMIVTQARVWKGARTNYANLDLEELTDSELLDAQWGDGTGANPAGGDYTIAPNAVSNTRMDVTATDLTQPTCLAVANQLNPSTFDNASATCAAGVLTAVFR